MAQIAQQDHLFIDVSASYADASTTRTYTFVFGGATLQSVTATETISA